MIRTLSLPVIAALMLAVTPAATAHAQSDGQKQPSPTDRLQEGAAAIVDGLRMLMDQLQSYQPPEILPNGDIIIRRRPPTEPAPPRPETEPPADNKPRPL